MYGLSIIEKKNPLKFATLNLCINEGTRKKRSSEFLYLMTILLSLEFLNSSFLKKRKWSTCTMFLNKTNFIWVSLYLVGSPAKSCYLFIYLFIFGIINWDICGLINIDECYRWICKLLLENITLQQSILGIISVSTADLTNSFNPFPPKGFPIDE